jgi:hypothetical protein
MEDIKNQLKMSEEMQTALLIFFKKLIKSCVVEALNDQKSNKTQESPKETEEWLSTEDAKKLLGIKSKSKLQQLRDHGDILFSQHGRILKYSRKSILDFLKRNIINVHSPQFKNAA